MKEKANIQIKSVRKIGLINTASIPVGLATTIVTARLFGVSYEIECFFIATGVRMMLQQFLQAGRSSNIIIPAYHKIQKEHGKPASQEFFSVVLNWSFILAIALGCFGLMASEYLIHLRAIGFTEAELSLAVKLFNFLIPSCVLIYLAAIMRSLVNAEMQFGKPELAGLLAQISSLLTILALFHSYGIWALVAAAWVNAVVQFTSLGYVLFNAGYKHKFLFQSKHYNIWKYYRYLGATTFYAAATQSWGFALDSALTTLPHGVLAVFKYSHQLYNRIPNLAIIPISRVYFSHFSKAVAEGSGHAKKMCGEATALACAVSIPITVLFLFVCSDVLLIVWGTKSFEPDDLLLGQKIILCLVLLVSLQAFSSIWKSLAVASGYLYTLDFGFIGAQLVSAAFAWYTIHWLGIDGAILAVIFNLLLLTLIPLLILTFTKARQNFNFPTITFLKWALILIAGLFMSAIYRQFIFDSPNLTVPFTIVRIVATTTIVASSIAILANMLKIQEIINFTHWLFNVLKRLSSNKFKGTLKL